MKSNLNDPFVEKVMEGLKISFSKLVEKYKREDDELIFSENGKIVRIKAKDIKL
jgi:hypothetical protein